VVLLVGEDLVFVDVRATAEALAFQVAHVEGDVGAGTDTEDRVAAANRFSVVIAYAPGYIWKTVSLSFFWTG
jgi:hypothetical protein